MSGVSEHHVISQDTRIGFFTQGHGPELVLVQGAKATAQQYGELTRELSREFPSIGPTGAAVG